MSASPAALPRHILRLADLPGRHETAVDFAPDAAGRAAIAAELGLSDLRKLRLAGRMVPVGRTDWRLEATLGATVVQPCVVTLDPVVTRIERRGAAHLDRRPDRTGGAGS